MSGEVKVYVLPALIAFGIVLLIILVSMFGSNEGVTGAIIGGIDAGKIKTIFSIIGAAMLVTCIILILRNFKKY